MSTERNKQTAREVLDAVGRGDAEALAGMLAPDATWWLLGQGPHDTAIPRDVFLDAIGRRIKRRFTTPLSFTINGLTAEGDRVAVEAEATAQMAQGGAYHNMYHFLFVFDGDKVKVGREYLDTAYMNSTRPAK